MKNTSLTTRLALAFGFVVSFGIILTIVSALSLKSTIAKFNDVSDHVLPRVNLANENIQAAYDYARAFTFLTLASGQASADKDAVERAKKVLVDTVQLVTSNVDKLKAMDLSSREAELLQAAIDKRAAYGASRNRVLEMTKAGKSEEALGVIFAETNGLQSVYIEAIKEFIRYEQSLVSAGVTSANESYGSSLMWLGAVAVGSLIASVAIGIAFSRSILHSLGGEPAYAAQVVRRIADGHLDVEVHTNGAGQDSLLAAMRAMQTNIAQVVARVRSGTESIATASNEMASGSRSLSMRTEEQASALEETAASMEELSGTVRQNADNALQANQLAMGASAVAERGGEVVGRVVELMKAINAQAKKISDIISVVDGIAFQTNILALNAAVEAARAGEQGRGFAVVAGEVRTLARRSADAAKEIKSLINTSSDTVEAGTELANEAGLTMSEVVTAIRRVVDVVAEISAASQEQSRGVEQIGEAVVHMDKATQQNAALVEQSAAAVDSLRNQSEQLLAAISAFSVAKQSA